MKNFIIFLLVLVILGGTWFFFFNKISTDNAANPASTAQNLDKPDASNATFTIEDEKVTLSNGSNSTEDESGTVIETKILEEEAYGDLNNDSKEDVAILLRQSGGGSGTFIYVAAFVSGTLTYKGSNALFLGDRVSPQSVSITNSVVTVKYLDRKPDEPFSADPTIPVTKQFLFQKGTLVEK